ncbi:MAG: DUF1501 domain-containing protein [Acidobacteria bacterium]|nr:DUF1501 domain-containing protein [Acidobacteriota bacterium]
MRLLAPISRRALLRVGSLAAGGLRLPQLLSAAPGRGLACIVIFQSGGNCQLSTWDPKPGAPPEIRGSFQPLPTSVPGLHFTDLVPRTAAIAHKLTVIRSMTSDIAIHDVARRYVMSGTRPRTELNHPSFGAVLSKEFGSRNGLPPFVSIPGREDSAEAGFLGSQYDQFVAGDPREKDFRVKDVALPEGMPFEEAVANRRLLEALDRRFEAAARSPLMPAMDSFSKKAFELVSSTATREAFNIHAEPDALRDRYGRTTVGQGALLARRLVESGVRLVSVYHGGYDTHTGHEPQFRKIIPDFDLAFSGLVDDLEQRGLLHTTLVIAMGEFGRTPKVNPAGGRDHWPGVFSVVMAGAGLPRGAVLGRSDATASLPAERPVKVEDLAATIYAILGVDYHKQYPGPGRPVAIVKDGEPVKELVG